MHGRSVRCCFFPTGDISTFLFEQVPVAFANFDSAPHRPGEKNRKLLPAATVRSFAMTRPERGATFGPRP